MPSWIMEIRVSINVVEKSKKNLEKSEQLFKGVSAVGKALWFRIQDPGRLQESFDSLLRQSNETHEITKLNCQDKGSMAPSSDGGDCLVCCYLAWWVKPPQRLHFTPADRPGLAGPPCAAPLANEELHVDCSPEQRTYCLWRESL